MVAVVWTDESFGVEASAALGARLGDTARVATLRAEAAAAARLLPWPDSYTERPWKYLDVSKLDLSPYRPALDAVARSGEAQRSCPVTGEHAAVLAQENSETVFAEAAPPGVMLTSFEAAGPDAAAIIAANLASAVPALRNRFTALHYALLRGGVLVHVAAGTEVDLPVRLVRQYVSAGQFATPHTLIVTGPNSRVNVIEEYSSGEGDILAVPVVEVVPGAGSQVRYTAVHRWGPETKVFGEQRLIGAQDAAFTSLHVATGGRVVKMHLESSLAGRGSSSELYGVSLTGDAQHVDFATLQDHIGPDTRSDLLFKSALKDRSRAVYYGVTRVGLEARNADANQENRNLLMSKTAKADSDPVLEILTSEIVRCSHGATAGPVDQEQLFYLQTRGIPYRVAEGMLVRAFLGQVLDRVPDEALRDELAGVIEARL
jgi:Fe-S cluster assembly protein SufD